MYGDSISETRKIMNSVVQLNSVDEFITEQLFCSELVAFHKMVVYIYVPSLIPPPPLFSPLFSSFIYFFICITHCHLVPHSLFFSLLISEEP